jgi:hypothetical protein
MLAIAAFPRLRDASSASDARGPSRRRSETPCAADPAIDVGSEERKKRSTRALFLRERKPGKAFALRGLATPTTRVTPRAVARAAVRSKLSARPSRLVRARACARASTETTTGKVNVVCVFCLNRKYRTFARGRAQKYDFCDLDEIRTQNSYFWHGKFN